MFTALHTLLTATPTVNVPSLSDIYDSSVIDTLVNIFKKCTETFTIFPVNVFLILALVGISVGLVSSMARSFRK